MLVNSRIRVVLAVFCVLCGAMPAVQAAEARTAVESPGAGADDALDLTPEQKVAIKAVRDAFKASQQLVREDLSRKNEALWAEMDADNPDRVKADALAAEIKLLQGRFVENRVDMVFKLRAIYTPAQLKVMKRRLESRLQSSFVRKAVKAKPGKIKKQDLKKK